MKTKFKLTHMLSAFLYAGLSYCKRKKVGALVVKKGSVISFGYNGTPAGWDNTCEEEKQQWATDEFGSNGYTENTVVTKDCVSHAEHNAITKLAKSSESAKGAVLFCTTAPCVNCSKLIADAGIKKVYYSEIYRSDEGLKYLKERKVKLEQIHLPEDETNGLLEICSRLT